MKISKTIYFTICLLLIGLYLSCTLNIALETPSNTEYDSLSISSFFVLDSNGDKVDNVNPIPVDSSFSLIFDQILEDITDHLSYLKSQIKLTDIRGGSVDLGIEVTEAGKIKISPSDDLSYATVYQLIVKKGLTIGNYQITNDIVYSIATVGENSDSSLIVIYNNKKISSGENNITIVLPVGADASSVSFTLEVGERATLQEGNNPLPLNENNQYSAIMDFSGGATHDFTVTAQDRSVTVYTVKIQLMDSKEIFSFTFLQEDNPFLGTNITMDITGQDITKTITNVEGISDLIPNIVHNGSNISPISKVTQDFSTNNNYTVTAFDKTTSIYTVSLTNYYGVTIDTNGGSITGAPVTIEYVLYEDKATLPSEPSQEHYGFKGWYDAPEGGNIFDFSTAITTKATVYAQWTNKQYQVRFYQGGNLLDTVSVPSLKVIPALDYPTPSLARQLYKWYSDSGFIQLYNKNSLVVGDLDLYGKYFSTDGSFQSIIENGIIPSDLVNYDDMSEVILSNYTAGATVIARYVTAGGNGDGSSWANAGGDIKAMIDGISDASENRIYIVLIASGTYKPSASYVMKNHVALVGGFMAGGYDRVGGTHLDGGNRKSVFYNNKNNLNNTALLYGVIVTNGNAYQGGGMYNWISSPTLINVTFSGNTTIGDYWNGHGAGGGMYNGDSSPTLINITFLGNMAYEGGGGMYNWVSSPTLINVAFSGNEAQYGGGMVNWDASSPTLINVTFSDNIANNHGGKRSQYGGGMFNNKSSPTLIDVTFSNNMANNGGGIYNMISSPTLNNVTFSGNTANNSGGGVFNYDNSSSTLSNVTFLDNTANNNGGGMANYSSSTLIKVTFSGNRANYGGGMYNRFSSTLINVIFSGNKAKYGGGMYNNFFATLINVIFSDNTANYGGGILQNTDFLSGLRAHEGLSLTLINTILWKNDNGNIYMGNNDRFIETVNLYHSLIEGGTSASMSATGIRLSNNTTANPININSESVITSDPVLGTLANNGGDIDTILIGSGSLAQNAGVYVRGIKSEYWGSYPETNLYYSMDNTSWFSDPGLMNPVANLPGNADDLTATDARGYGRVGRPDMGVYEVGGSP